MIMRWYDKTVEEVAELTDGDVTNGLSSESAAERLYRNGRNEIFPIEHKTLSGYLSDFSTNGLSLLLILVSLVSLFFKEYLIAISAIVLVGVSYFVTFVAYYSSRKVLERGARNSLPSARVVRDGKLQIVKQDEIVVGDLVQLSAGDIVPCDARIISTDRLFIVETGITDGVGSIEKNADFVEYRNVPPHMCFNMAWASTIVTKGSGLALTCEVGKNTLVRRTGKNRPAAEYHKLAIFDTLGKIGGKMSLFYILAAFVISLAGLFPSVGVNPIMTVLVSLSLGSAGLSEFLVLFAYIIVACGLFDSLREGVGDDTGDEYGGSPGKQGRAVGKRAKKSSLIKNADRLDTLKSVTTVIVPPEAIYSRRDMTLEKIYVSGTLYDASQRDFADKCSRLLKYAVVTTGLYGENKLSNVGDEGSDFYTFEEDAILRAAFENKLYNRSLENEYPLIDFKRKNDYNRFDTSLVRFNGDNTVLLRGEADEILALCTHYCENGRVFRLGPVERSKIEVAATQLMRQAYRVVAIASKTSRFNSLTKLRDSQNDLIFEGFIALIEPILPGVSQTLSRFNKANIKVMLFCDDVSEKDFQIARAIGMVQSRENVITGEEIRALGDENGVLSGEKIIKYTMMTGMTVADKETVIKALKEKGETVAFMGNKLREITLLREADIGITESMYLTSSSDSGKARYDGCEALRFVADALVTMVGTDSGGGLTAVSEVIGSAKNINNNIDRMLRYLLGTQSVRVLLVLWSLLSGKMLLTPTAILVLGLIFDFSAVLIMAFKKPSMRILREEGRDISEKSMMKMSGKCIINGLLCGAFMLASVYLLTLTKVIPTASFAAAVFLSSVTLSASMLLICLGEGSHAKRELRLSRAELIYLLAVLAFTVVCGTVKKITALITTSLVISPSVLVAAFAVPIFAPLFALLTVKIFGGKAFKRFCRRSARRIALARENYKKKKSEKKKSEKAKIDIDFDDEI